VGTRKATPITQSGPRYVPTFRLSDFPTYFVTVIEPFIPIGRWGVQYIL